MLKHFLELVSWAANLFNPPPLNTMSRAQKIGRILLVTVTLTVTCVLMAMLGALALFVLEQGREMFRSTPELVYGVEIILASICVNTVCVWLLLRIKNADRKLVPDQP